MSDTSQHSKTKAGSFSEEIESALSPDHRNSIILFEHNTKKYIIKEAPTNDDHAPQSTVIKVADPVISLCDVAQIRTVFNAIDINHDGYIERSELRKFMKGISRDSLPLGMAKTILKHADQNKDGVLSFDEFFQLCQVHSWLPKSFIKACGKVTGFSTDDPGVQSYEYYYIHSQTFPLVVYTLTIIQFIFYLNDQLHISAEKAKDSFSILSVTFLYNFEKKHEIWRFVTYMMVHADLCHLASNLFLLISAGIPLEVIHGSRCILLIYCMSVFFGAICVSSLSNCMYLVGSSAGAFGLFGAHFSTLILNWNEMHYKIIRILIISTYVVVNSFLCVYSMIKIDFGLTNSTISHVSGFVMGLLMGIVTLRNIKVLEFEKQLQKIVRVVIVCIVIAAVGLTIWTPKEFKINP